MDVKRMKKEELYNALLCKEEEVRLANETNASLIEHNTRLVTTVAESKNIMSQLRAKTTELSKEIVGKEDVIAKLKKELIETNKKVIVVTNKSNSYLDIIKELRGKIDNQDATINHLSVRKASLEKDCYEFEEELNNYKNSVEGYIKEIDTLKAENTHLKDNLIAMSEDNRICHEAYDKAVEDKCECIDYYQGIVKKLKKRVINNGIITIVGMITMLLIILLS